MSAEEAVLWKGRSHQMINFWPLLISLLSVILLITAGVMWWPWFALLSLVPLGFGGWVWLGTRLKVFEFTTERLRVYEGILNQEINEIELYRVKDIKLLKPFWLRVFGLSTILMNTSDRSCPVLEIKAIREGSMIREKLRDQVEILRDKKRVREVDFEGSEGDEFEDFDDALNS